MWAVAAVLAAPHDFGQELARAAAPRRSQLDPDKVRSDAAAGIAALRSSQPAGPGQALLHDLEKLQAMGDDAARASLLETSGGSHRADPLLGPDADLTVLEPGIEAMDRLDWKALDKASGDPAEEPSELPAPESSAERAAAAERAIERESGDGWSSFVELPGPDLHDRFDRMDKLRHKLQSLDRQFKQDGRFVEKKFKKLEPKSSFVQVSEAPAQSPLAALARIRERMREHHDEYREAYRETLGKLHPRASFVETPEDARLLQDQMEEEKRNFVEREAALRVDDAARQRAWHRALKQAGSFLEAGTPTPEAVARLKEEVAGEERTFAEQEAVLHEANAARERILHPEPGGSLLEGLPTQSPADAYAASIRALGRQSAAATARAGDAMDRMAESLEPNPYAYELHVPGAEPVDYEAGMDERFTPSFGAVEYGPSALTGDRVSDELSLPIASWLEERDHLRRGA